MHFTEALNLMINRDTIAAIWGEGDALTKIEYLHGPMFALDWNFRTAARHGFLRCGGLVLGFMVTAMNAALATAGDNASEFWQVAL